MSCSSIALDLRNFAFDESLVRVVMDEGGHPWFVAKDVARALGYSLSSIQTPGKLFQHIPVEWVNRNPIPVRSENSVAQERDMLCLSEQGLYFFVARSDKPAALPFQKWLAGEVLPSIRQTGAYSLPGSRTAGELGISLSAMRIPIHIKEKLLNNAIHLAKAEDRISEYPQIFAQLCNLLAEGSAECSLGREVVAVESVQIFIDECCVPNDSPKRRVPLKMVYSAYQNWCDMGGRGYSPVTAHRFKEIVRRLYGPSALHRPRPSKHSENKERPFFLVGLMLKRGAPFP